MLSPTPVVSKEAAPPPAPAQAPDRLLDPASLFIAFGEVVAGGAIAAGGHLDLPALPALIVAAMSTQAASAMIAAPSPAHGRLSRTRCRLLGLGLLLLACVCTIPVGTLALGLVAALAGTLLVYEMGAKRHALLGPLLEAFRHALTFWLGLSLVAASGTALAYLVAIPALYAMAVRVLRQPSPQAIHAGLALVVLMTALAALLSLLQAAPFGQFALPFIALLAFQTLPHFAYALAEPDADTQYAAYCAGLLGTPIVDAALAAAFAGPWIGLAVLALRPLLTPVGRRWAFA